MRVLIVGIVLSALVAVSCADAGTQRAAPNLRIVSDRPFVVVGGGFRPDERVRLLVAAPKPATRNVRAGRLGRFRVVLGVTVTSCSGVVIQALGNLGSRAMVDRTAPDCEPIV